jgi:hypothetical protein
MFRRLSGAADERAVAAQVLGGPTALVREIELGRRERQAISRWQQALFPMCSGDPAERA